MSTIIFTNNNEAETRVTATEGTSVMRAAVSNGIKGIIGECGGQAMCATCHVYVQHEYLSRLPEISEDEEEMLDCTSSERTERSRLSCQLEMGQDLDEVSVEIPESQV